MALYKQFFDDRKFQKSEQITTRSYRTRVFIDLRVVCAVYACCLPRNFFEIIEENDDQGSGQRSRYNAQFGTVTSATIFRISVTLSTGFIIVSKRLRLRRLLFHNSRDRTAHVIFTQLSTRLKTLDITTSYDFTTSFCDINRKIDNDIDKR